MVSFLEGQSWSLVSVVVEYLSSWSFGPVVRNCEWHPFCRPRLFRRILFFFFAVMEDFIFGVVAAVGVGVAAVALALLCAFG